MRNLLKAAWAAFSVIFITVSIPVSIFLIGYLLVCLNVHTVLAIIISGLIALFVLLTINFYYYKS